MQLKSSPTRIAGLDTVRAVAALSVAFAHLLGPSMPGIAKYIFTGHPAVIAFFIVSGFCIHHPYRHTELKVAPFLAGRILRIFPPTVFAFALAQAIGIRAYNPIDGYILWSVVCEMVYYCLYPLFLFVCRRVGWVPLIIGATIGSYCTAIGYGSNQYGSANIYGPGLNWLVGLPAWLIGCYLADKFDEAKIAGGVWFWRIVTAVTASVLYWATMNTSVGFYLTMMPFALLATLWILSEIKEAETSGPNRLMERIGAACFSIYLIHVIAAAAIEKLIINDPLLVCPLALFLVYPFYRWIEKPSHEAARRAKAFFKAGPISAS